MNLGNCFHWSLVVRRWSKKEVAMKRRPLVQFGLIALALVALTAPVYAGGWAVVTLDSLPAEPRAGQTLHLGFMVRQHGVTPIDSPYGAGEPMKPSLVATNKGNRETLRATARKDGPVGHFVVDITFPAAGTWEWQIIPEPFAGTKLGQITVLPAAVAPGTASEKALAPAAPAAVSEKSVGPAVSPIALRWIGVFLLVTAAALALSSRLGVVTLRRALGSR
jgi:hypothetical protein